MASYRTQVDELQDALDEQADELSKSKFSENDKTREMSSQIDNLNLIVNNMRQAVGFHTISKDYFSEL